MYRADYYEKEKLRHDVSDPNQTQETQFLLRNNRNPDGGHNPTIYHHHQHPNVKLPHSRTPALKDENNFDDKRHPLGPRPVKLSPSWEDKNLTNDELNFKHLILGEEFVDQPPRDRCNFVYLILLLHGVGTLMPWNMFINAKTYFQEYKLANEENDPTVETYKSNFMLYITMAAQIPNVIFNFINLFLKIGGNLTSRIVISILVEIIIFVGTVVLAMVDSSSWPVIFFWLTIASVVLLNMANGIYQNSIYGLAGNFPMKYSNAVVLGSNISGVIVSLINIAAIAIAPNKRTSAIYYFITALFVLLACFDTYFALPLSRFYRFYEHQSEKQTKAGLTNSINSRTPYWYIFKKAIPQLWNVFFTFFITLSLFPSLHSDIKMSDPNFVIPEEYYDSVMCFLVFNFFSMIGNLFPFLCRIRSRWLWLPVLLRILLVPAFIFCNYRPKGHIRILPVLICNDWAHFGLGITLGLTGGYFASLSMMYAPKCVDSQYSHIAGMMAATALILGIFSGILTSYLMPVLISSISFDLPEGFPCNLTALAR